MIYWSFAENTFVGKHDARVEHFVSNFLGFFLRGEGVNHNGHFTYNGKVCFTLSPQMPMGSETDCTQAEECNAVQQSERLLNTAMLLSLAPSIAIAWMVE